MKVLANNIILAIIRVMLWKKELRNLCDISNGTIALLFCKIVKINVDRKIKTVIKIKRAAYGWIGSGTGVFV